MRKYTHLFFTLFFAFLTGFAQSQEYSVIRKSVVGGEGGWDYLIADGENKRLYVSHSTQVEVLNLETHEKIGVIAGLQGVHGIAVVPKKGRGITTNGRTNTATIFDLKTLKAITEVPTGKNPDALLYDNYSDRVFIFNHSGGDATVVDIGDGKVLGTVTLGGTAVEAGVSDENGTIFVNLEDTNEVVSFDAKTLQIKNRWKIPGNEPTGITMDRKTHRLFSVCHSEVVVIINSDDGSIMTTLPIGKRVDGIVFDEQSRRAFTSNGEGTVTVIEEISPNEFKVVETIKTQLGARTITMNPKNHHVYVSTAEYGTTPAATAEVPNPRPPVLPGTFMILEIGKK